MLADIILIALLLINILIGLKRGFFLMISRLILLVLSLAVTLLLVGPLAGLLEKAAFMAPLAEKINQAVIAPLENTATTIGEAIGSFKLPPFLAELVQSKLPSASTGINQALPELSAILFRFALSAMIFILLFILIALAIHLIARSLTRLSDAVPVLGALNRIGGLIVGLALGLAEVCIVLLVLGFAAPYLPTVAEWIDKSWIAKYFYSINILYYLV